MQGLTGERCKTENAGRNIPEREYTPEKSMARIIAIISKYCDEYIYEKDFYKLQNEIEKEMKKIYAQIKGGK